MVVAPDGEAGGGLMLEIEIRARLGDFELDATFVAPNGVTALFGRSGSGKTSVVNAVAGLLRPDTGQILVDGAPLFDAAAGIDVPTRRRRIGYVFQDARLFPHMTVKQNLRYGGAHDEVRVIEMLGLGPLLLRRPARLSGGEKQRVALGRALMSNPRLLLMDEPLAGLDEARKAEILPYLEVLRDEARVPILYVSHAMPEVARLATTLVVMDAGKVRRAGPLVEILADPEAVAMLGVRAAGAVIVAQIERYDADDDLSELTFSGGRLVLPGKLGAIGHRVRLRVAAQDIVLARNKPEGLSALNVLSVVVTGLTQGNGPGVAVGLCCGEDALLARVTRRSQNAMQLAVGQQLYAIIKATAVAPEDVGKGG